MQQSNWQRYFSILATAIVIVLIAVVLITRNNKSVTGIKQVFKVVETNGQQQIP